MKQDLLTQKLNDKKQKMETQKRSHKEHVAQLKEKFNMERENLIREQKAVLEHKLKVSLVGCGQSLMDKMLVSQ